MRDTDHVFWEGTMVYTTAECRSDGAHRQVGRLARTMAVARPVWHYEVAPRITGRLKNSVDKPDSIAAVIGTLELHQARHGGGFVEYIVADRPAHELVSMGLVR